MTSKLDRLSGKSSIDQKEISKFLKLPDWWNPDGDCKILHEINPLRLDYIIQTIKQNFSQQKRLPQDIKILDVGCGAGLVSEALAMSGFKVTGIDASSECIKQAQKHQAQNSANTSNLDLEYKISTIEDEVALDKKYDVILALEILEHVSNADSFIKNISKNLASDGVAIFSTINRNVKSRLLAIFLAENILHWVPKNTHLYEKFIRIDELRSHLSSSNMKITRTKGMNFSPTSGLWHLSDDCSVNYFAIAKFNKN